MPTVRESRTSTGIPTRAAASRAESTVPDSSPEMWSDTTDSKPPRWAARYACSNCPGEGREVLTGLPLARATAIVSAMSSSPSP